LSEEIANFFGVLEYWSIEIKRVERSTGRIGARDIAVFKGLLGYETQDE
jgi:hypothetical protein